MYQKSNTQISDQCMCMYMNLNIYLNTFVLYVFKYINSYTYSYKFECIIIIYIQKIIIICNNYQLIIITYYNLKTYNIQDVNLNTYLVFSFDNKIPFLDRQRTQDQFTIFNLIYNLSIITIKKITGASRKFHIEP
eukprot:EC096269.1.p1 GENE.EC096269.1~~EC096269.1.p1  ORF type:complete len:135 (-),score=1.13 EC096269.1:32-436(-)